MPDRPTDRPRPIGRPGSNNNLSYTKPQLNEKSEYHSKMTKLLSSTPTFAYKALTGDNMSGWAGGCGYGEDKDDEEEGQRQFKKISKVDSILVKNKVYWILIICIA